MLTAALSVCFFFFFTFAEEGMKCKGTRNTITQLNESHEIFIMKLNEDFPLCLLLIIRHAAHLYPEFEKPLH